MGTFATSVQEYIRDRMLETHPSGDWKTEYSIAGTPVDIIGEDTSSLYLMELEWRRADPADNAAKLFRHLHTGNIEAANVVVFQIFTEYYDLSRGGISTKRKNAEFVGKLAAESLDGVAYEPVEFGIEPPKQGGEWPPSWEATADEVVDRVSEKLRQQNSPDR